MTTPAARPTTTHVGEYEGRPDIWVAPELVERLGVGLGDSVDTELRDGELILRPATDDEPATDTDRWEYDGHRGRIRVRSPVVEAGDDDLELTVRTLPVEQGEVPLGFEYDIEERYASASANLSPADAEALAADLREQARVARESNDE